MVRIRKDRSIWVDKPNNDTGFGLRVDFADEDGIQIVETDGEKDVERVYVYKTEIVKLIEVLQEIITNE